MGYRADEAKRLLKEAIENGKTDDIADAIEYLIRVIAEKLVD